MFCPSCGEELVENAKFCKSCGKEIRQTETNTDTVHTGEYHVPTVEKSYKFAVILGYALAVLIPILGIVIAIYLYTRKDSENANRHAKFILIVAAIIWFISFMLIR
ncbi:MAG: zinc-ribbon domain-containing protein [Methanobrevibacter sp.]|nr:zinc-ribbon domain-containing protein [Methanobrevibacter sp.]